MFLAFYFGASEEETSWIQCYNDCLHFLSGGVLGHTGSLEKAVVSTVLNRTQNHICAYIFHLHLDLKDHFNKWASGGMIWLHYLCLVHSKGSKEHNSNMLIMRSNACFGGCLSLWLWFLPLSFAALAMDQFGFSCSGISHVTKLMQ